MPSARFEPAIPAVKRPKTFALDRTATGIGKQRSVALKQLQISQTIRYTSTYLMITRCAYLWRYVFNKSRISKTYSCKTLPDLDILFHVQMTNEMHNSVNNFYSIVFSCSTCFERIASSSSGAPLVILYHAVWYNRYNRAIRRVQLLWSCRKDSLSYNYSILSSAPDDELVIRSKHVEREKTVE